MLSLTQRAHDGELVLRDPLTGAAFGIDDAGLCDDLREWLLASGTDLVCGADPREADDSGDAAA